MSPTKFGFADDFPIEMVVTLTLEEQKGKTKLTLRHAGHPAGEMSEMATEGWNQSLDKMAAVLRKSRVKEMRS